MAAVVGEDRVDVGVEVVDEADRVRLLADVRVRRPDELSQREQVEERLLEAADEEHPLVEGRGLGHLEVPEVGEPLRDGRLFLLRQLVALGALELAEHDLAQLGGTSSRAWSSRGSTSRR